MIDKLKQRFRSKTYWAALIGALITAAEVNSGLLSSYVGADMRPWMLALWPILMGVMREVTATALSDK